MKKEIEAPKKIRGAVLLVTMFLSIPVLSQRGIKTRPPLTARQPPMVPARNPLNMASLIFS